MACICTVANQIPKEPDRTTFLVQATKRFYSIMDSSYDVAKRNFHRYWSAESKIKDGGGALQTDKTGKFVVLPERSSSSRMEATTTTLFLRNKININKVKASVLSILNECGLEKVGRSMRNKRRNICSRTFLVKYHKPEYSLRLVVD